MNVEGKGRVPGWKKRVLRFADLGELPFLSIETDGRPFPQIIEANLEVFILQARRVHEIIARQREHRSARRFFRHLPAVRLYKIVTRQAAAFWQNLR